MASELSEALYRIQPRERRVLESKGANRKTRCARGSDVARKERALRRLFLVLGLRDAMSKAEVRTEAYRAYHLGMLTRDQAVLLGCSDGLGRVRGARG